MTSGWLVELEYEKSYVLFEVVYSMSETDIDSMKPCHRPTYTDSMNEYLIESYESRESVFIAHFWMEVKEKMAGQPWHMLIYLALVFSLCQIF